MAKTENETYQFDFHCTVSIEAASLSKAIKNFYEKHPNCTDHDIKHIRQDSQYMGCEYSKTAGKYIWYPPGCQCGESDCILDPMRDIAMTCADQSEIDDRWVPCNHPDPDDNYCYYYDDEDK